MSEKTCGTCKNHYMEVATDILWCDAREDDDSCPSWEPRYALDWVPLCYDDGTPIEGAELPWTTEERLVKTDQADEEYAMAYYGPLSEKWMHWPPRTLHPVPFPYKVIAYCRTIPGPTLPGREVLDVKGNARMGLTDKGAGDE